MRPRRIPFAVSYIGETPECYERIGEESRLRMFLSMKPEWNWSHDVLKEYFEVHEGHPAVAGFCKRFLGLPAPVASFLQSR